MRYELTDCGWFAIKCLPCSTARLSPAYTRRRIMLRSELGKSAGNLKHQPRRRVWSCRLTADRGIDRRRKPLAFG
jgi:hypothetical protein